MRSLIFITDVLSLKGFSKSNTNNFNYLSVQKELRTYNNKIVDTQC